jgi:hypothetical protein
MKRPARPDGSFSQGTVKAIWDRDEGRCAWCGTPIWGERGLNWSVHHLEPRGMGGTNSPHAGRPSNGVLLHGSGTTGCHGYVEQHRDEAEAKGFLISRNGMERPGNVRIDHAVHGKCLLADDGTVRRGVEVF